MSETQQKFGNVTIQEADRGTCREPRETPDKPGTFERCGNSAVIEIVHADGCTFRYCAVHARESWKEEAGYYDE